MPGLPAALQLAGRRAVIVGGGDQAATLASLLLEHGASVTVIAACAAPPLLALSASERVSLVPRAYVRGDLADAFLTACFESGETAAAIAAEASAERCLVSVAGRPDLSTVCLVDCPGVTEEPA